MGTRLRRSIFAFFAVVGLVVAGVTGAAQAAPASGLSAAQGQLNAAGSSLLQQVHFCHRRGVIGPFTGLRHRHVGPNCRWVRVRRHRRNACARWSRRCWNRCFDAPRPNRCARRCFNRNAPDRCF